LDAFRRFGVDVVAVAGGFGFGGGVDGFLGLGGEFVDFVGGEDAAFGEDFLLFGGEGGGFDRGTGFAVGADAFEAVGFAAGEVLDFFADADGAPVVAAHGAEVGVDVEVFIVVGAGGVGVEGEVEVLLPVESGAGLGEFVIAVAGVGDAEGDVGGVGRDFGVT
jgi:hypothetical protein